MLKVFSEYVQARINIVTLTDKLRNRTWKGEVEKVTQIPTIMISSNVTIAIDNDNDDMINEAKKIQKKKNSHTGLDWTAST